jgi:hypothetical protein
MVIETVDPWARLLRNLDNLADAAQQAREGLALQAHLVVCDVEANEALSRSVRAFDETFDALSALRDRIRAAPPGGLA